METETKKSPKGRNFDRIKDLQAQDIVSIGNFKRICPLGSGNYGKVFLVRKLGGSDKDRVYAMKVITTTGKPKLLQRANEEGRILKKIRGLPFLPYLYYTFHTPSKLHLVLDFAAGGDLYGCIYEKGHVLTVVEIRFYIAEIVLALDYLHTSGVIYRDLKPENILLDCHGHIILTDFGLSKMFPPNLKKTQRRTTSVCGTESYYAPELIRFQHRAGYDKAVDYWSLGVLTYEMWFHITPFRNRKEKETSKLFKRILTDKALFPLDFPSLSLQLFIMDLLIKDPRKRLGSGVGGVSEVKEHPFFEEYNWSDVENKRLQPPFIPVLSSPADTKYIPDYLTQIPLKLFSKE